MLPNECRSLFEDRHVEPNQPSAADAGNTSLLTAVIDTCIAAQAVTG
jgi:hypothetical protein